MKILFNKYALISLLSFILLVGFFIYRQQERRENYWPEFTVSADQPTSKLIDYEILYDYFGYNRFRGMIEHEMQLTGTGPDGWEEEVIKITKNLSLENDSWPSSPKIHGKFVEDLIQGLYLVSQNIPSTYFRENTELRVDLSFLPKFNQHTSQQRLFREYNIPSFHHIGQLSNFINKTPSNFTEKVYESYSPSSGEVYDYKGGVISLIFSPTFKEYEAILRYRRFYKINFKGDLDLVLKDSPIKMSLTHFNDPPSKEFHVTSDITKKIKVRGNNIEILSTELDYIPGLLLDKKSERPSEMFLSAILIPENYNTGQLNLRGRIDDIEFFSTVELLNFSLENKEFNLEESIIRTDFLNLPPEIKRYGPLARGRLKNKINLEILKNQLPQVFSSFQLERFLPGSFKWEEK